MGCIPIVEVPQGLFLTHILKNSWSSFCTKLKADFWGSFWSKIEVGFQNNFSHAFVNPKYMFGQNCVQWFRRYLELSTDIFSKDTLGT